MTQFHKVYYKSELFCSIERIILFLLFILQMLKEDLSDEI